MKHTIIAFFFLIVSALFNNHLMASEFEVEEFSLLKINSAITPATHDYLKHHFQKLPAKSLVIIKINTPGGLISTTKDIISLISNEDRPVAIWITPEGASASSAGAIIASAAHFIFMSPGTNLGAATPVGLGEDLGKDSDNRKKALSDLTATVRSLSQLRGRPAKAFEDMIQLATSLTDQEALKEKIIHGVVSTQAQLINSLQGQKFKMKGQEFTLSIKPHSAAVDYNQSLGQRILEVLANPSTAYILFLIGVALLYFEFQAPGGYVMGGIGLCFITLAAISFQILPLNWGAFGLMIIGVVLVIMEIFITSYAVLGLAGLGSFVMGSLFLFNDEAGFISVEYSVLLSTLAGVLVSSAVIVTYLLKEKKHKNQLGQFFLPVGTKGSVMTVTGNNYQVKVRGEIWNAISTDALEVGQKVQVTSVDGEKLTLLIKKDEESL
jgi:membrane-bound serine protease (ClpP class)